MKKKELLTRLIESDHELALRYEEDRLEEIEMQEEAAEMNRKIHESGESWDRWINSA